jgi:hypothetical protein
MIVTMSRQKYTTTAASVPIWMMAVKNAPGSSPGSMSSPTMRTCAEDEIGRNSVSACTIPSTAATSQSYIRLLENVGWERNHGSRRIG